MDCERRDETNCWTIRAETRRTSRSVRHARRLRRGSVPSMRIWRASFRPPSLSPSFRPALRARVRRERTRAWMDALPDIVHFASCGAATLACAAFAPLAATTVLTSGIAIALGSYVITTALRQSINAARTVGSIGYSTPTPIPNSQSSETAGSTLAWNAGNWELEVGS